MQIVISVDDTTGNLQVGTDVPVPVPLLAWHLEMARKAVIDEATRPRPAILPANGAILNRLNGGKPRE